MKRTHLISLLALLALAPRRRVRSARDAAHMRMRGSYLAMCSDPRRLLSVARKLLSGGEGVVNA
jgi:hypothetical protein